MRDEFGKPRRQRNILYYMVVAPGYPEFNGTGVVDGEYEVSHPGKLLIRKVIDMPPATSPSDTETLLTDVTPHLEVPSNGTFSDAGAESTAIVARDLLSFRVDRDDTLKRIVVSLQAAKLKEKQREFPLGSRSLLLPGYPMERKLEVYPENPELPPIP